MALVALVSVVADPIGDGRARGLFDLLVPDGQTLPSTVDVSGQRVLLTAATVAGQSPARSGRYWHITMTFPPQPIELWFSADGRMWLRSAKTGGVVMDLGINPYFLVGHPVTLDQVRALPTMPDALLAWMTDAVAHPEPGAGGKGMSAQMRDEFVLYGLISIVSELPAPPAVRSAAFKAIASYHGVRDLGPVPGGVGLVITSANGATARLVVDPVTASIVRTDFFVSTDGGLYYAGADDMFGLATGWTDTLPG